MALVLFLTATLIVSSLCLATLLWLKDWELSTGNMIMSGMRENLSRWSLFSIDFFEHTIPERSQRLWESFMLWLRGSARGALARALLSIEQMLERVLHFLRHGLTAERSNESQVSAFLQEVAEHKKRLIRTSNKRRSLHQISE
jgi:hypothetical protein